MPRVIGIDPGTVSIDLCGLEDGRLFLDRSIPTSDALADPARFVRLLEDAGPVDLVAGPSGYGLPLTRARDATDGDLRLALLGPPGEASGIGGLGAPFRALARSGSAARARWTAKSRFSRAAYRRTCCFGAAWRPSRAGRRGPTRSSGWRVPPRHGSASRRRRSSRAP